jgi:hypothetical protein
VEKKVKKVHLAFLKYLIEHQNPNDNYLNRFFVLKSILQRDGIPERYIEKSRTNLESAGLMFSDPYCQLFATDKGRSFYHRENEYYLLNFLQKALVTLKKYLIIPSAIGGTIYLVELLKSFSNYIIHFWC